jgi:hypothetical protein
MCVASQAAAAAADATLSLETPRLAVSTLLQLHNVPQSVPELEEAVLSQALEADYDRNVKRAGRGRILLAAGVPMMVFGIPLAAWAATADDCYIPSDNLNGSVIAGSVMAGAGLVLTSAGIAQLVRAGKKARADRTQRRFRRWAIPVGFASGLLSIGVMTAGFIGGSIGCYSS